MSNQALREALAGARMTEEGLAAAVGVDTKTVQRWVASEGRVPHQRHRASAAAALEVDEDVLWPQAVRTAIKTGADREIVAVYPYRSAVPKALWRDLVTRAGRRLVFAGYTNYFLWLDMNNFRTVLRRRLDQGVDVRFLIGDPDSEVTRERERIEAVPLTVSTRIRVTLDEVGKLRGDPAVKARFSDRHIAMSVFLFDDDAMVCTHIADRLGHDSPTIHLRRRGDDGMFDRYAAHVEHLWTEGRELTPPAAG